MNERYVVLEDALSDLRDIQGALEVLTYYTADPELLDTDAIVHAVAAIKDLFRIRLDMMEKAIVEADKTIRELKAKEVTGT